MKSTHSLRFWLAAILTGFSLALGAPTIEAQNCTSQNSAQVENGGWIKGAEVQVYIDPAITGDQRNAVKQAFTNWNGANGTDGNNSRVHYSFVDSPPPLLALTVLP